MKKKITILLTVVILCSFILIGCASTNSKENESETNTETNTISRYNEILKIIEDYKLPVGGTVNEEENTITYDNGYIFDKNTKIIVGRSYEPGSGPDEPTEEQYLGVIIGFINDIGYTQPWYTVENTQDIKGKLERLNEIKNYAENYEPIKNWIDETINYLEESDELIKTDNERAEELYDLACNNIEDFVAIIEEFAEKQLKK